MGNKYEEWKKNWFDEFGGLHNVRLPHPESTENPVTFLGWFIARAYDNFCLTGNMGADAADFIYELIFPDGQWRTTAITTDKNKGFSRDNWEMVCVILEILKEKGEGSRWVKTDDHTDALVDINSLVRGLTRNLPWFHKQMWHPRTMAIVWRTKLGPIAQPLMWTMWIYFYVTAKQGHKVKTALVPKDNIKPGELHYHNVKYKIAKTDGKLIADAVCTAFGLTRLQKKLRHWVATTVHQAPVPRHGEIVYVMTDKKDTWRWGSIRNCSHDYFQGNSNHPVTELYSEELNV